MADLKARFSLIDDMSEALSLIGDTGTSMLDDIERAGESVSAALDGIVNASSQTASSVDAVTRALSEASSETDNWTSAADNYDKSALEIVYTTEELAEMGLKVVDAYELAQEQFEMCETAASELSAVLEESSSSHETLAASINTADNALQELKESGKASEEALAALNEAENYATEAFENLEEAQKNANSAMEQYDAVITSGTTDTKELAAAAETAASAAEKLAVANQNAEKASEQLSAATDNATKSAEESGEKGVDAITAISETLIAKNLTEKVLEISGSVYELTEAFSEAEKTVVNATGATGDSLQRLDASLMNSFANQSGDLNTAAAAIGEINTRLGITDETLTVVTNDFLDYSRITGTDVVGSVQNVTKVMNRWNIEQENTTGILDKLAYEAQVSGISVDNLSSTLITGASTFQALDMSLDSSIALLGDLELYGMNSSTALTALRIAVTKFAEDGVQAGPAIRDAINEIASLKDESEATGIAIEIFGKRAGVEMANAIRSGAISVETFNNNLDVAEGTLKKTADAAETVGEKWDKSSNKLKAAFSTALSPAVESVSEGLARVTGAIGDFLSEHPMLTKAIAAIAAGLAAGTIALTAYTVATTVAIPAITAFGTALNAALGPIGWIAGGVTLLVGGISLLSGAFSDNKKEIEDYNGTMSECAEEISNTQAAYEKAVEMYGENSSAAKELSENLETLNAQFEKGGGMVSVYAEQADKVSESMKQLSDSQKKAYEEIDRTETAGLSAVAMLSALSEQSNHTNADLDLMSNYADYLNDEFNCDINVNYNTGELTGFNPEIIAGAVIEAANDERYQKAVQKLSGAEFQDGYIKAKVGVQELQKELDKLNAEKLEKNSITTFTDPSVAANMRDSVAIESDIQNVTKAIETYKATIAEAEAEINSYGAIIDSTGAFTENYYKILDKLIESQSNATDGTIQSASALSDEEAGIKAAAEAWQSYETQINNLAEAYNEAYEAAYESLTGQFDLFETVSTESADYMNSTVANAQAALDSQLEYWTSYSTNIEVLKNTSAEDLGITKENYNDLMAYVQGGSEEAAGLAASMVAEIQAGQTESVTELAKTIGEISTKQQEISEMTADWVTGFSEQMNQLVDKMDSTIDNLNLSQEATTAAKKTIKSYADAILAGGQDAVTAAKSVADQVAAALSSANTNINIGVTGNVPGHASGTTNAEEVFIAGENGPELIVGKAGSTVFPTSETDRIISAIGSKDNRVIAQLPERKVSAENTSNSPTIGSAESKHITLEIAGSGSIGLSGGSDKAQVLEIIQENLKPVLVGILESEIYEEGELNYEY